MKKLNPNQVQFARERLAENLALSFAIPVGIVVGLLWFLIFLTAHSSIGLHGWPSIGAAFLINTLLVTFFGFLYGYHRGQKLLDNNVRPHISKPKLVFDYIVLALGYMIIALALTVLVLNILSHAFVNVQMAAFSAALVVTVFTALTMYGITSLSVKIQSRDIVNALTLFLVGGVFISMSTVQDRAWWQINFSFLGTTSGPSAYIFNVTLVLSGLLLLCLTDHLLSDLQYVVKGDKTSVLRRTEIVKIMFILISLSLAGVGLFPWDIHPLLHTGSAYMLVVLFAIMVIGLKWLIPNLSKSFYANSYTLLGLLVVSFVLWQPFHYFNQTAFELIAFCLIFIWLVLFLRTITNLKNTDTLPTNRIEA